MPLTSWATSDKQSIINATGRQAVQVQNLYWFFFWILLAIYILVLLFLSLSIIRRRKTKQYPSITVPVTLPPPYESGLTIAVSIAVGATVILLFVFLIADFNTGRRINALATAPNPLNVHIKAQQWWWEVRYKDALLSNTVTTANELHLPTGKPVKIDLESQDVIHSFWVPNLSGKRDIIPGHPTTIYLQADKPGIFTGQCAEFCGHQHANMRFIVTAEPEAKFKQWLAAGRKTAATPQTQSEMRGQHVFMGSSCVMCHNISGTSARATVGPDLSHFASRPSIAAGTLPNNRGNLGGWILDSQHIKPGNRMPQNNIPAEDLQALVDYLESLK